MMHETICPLIVGPFGLALQWYMGVGTGLALCIGWLIGQRIRRLK